MRAGTLPHGRETNAFGDAGYRRVDKREGTKGPTWRVAASDARWTAAAPGLGRLKERNG